MNHQVHIKIFFDFICPWCWIAKRQLMRAIQQLQQRHPKIQLYIQWQGVQLLAELAPEGMDFYSFYLNRFPDLTALKQRQQQVCQIAETVHIKLNYEHISRMPNTAIIHQFFNACSKLGNMEQHEQLLEGIFSAYFQHGADISDSTVLQKIALDCGYQDIEFLAQSIKNNRFEKNISSQGVPYFIFNDGAEFLYGAQPAKVIYQTILSALGHQYQGMEK
ncbi:MULTISPECIES: DsbA family protein [unclassified Acinetobacter]|uniref:DsbA family oxidoreductase n=1 Tax=unclassified Acinetobacter TaxID=196816 RepID=UPI002934DF80|nr:MULTISPECIES: DsbA family protein [unclassified Acinetobacter]WOE30495.1 DsbA family protein [Acinetobacter sp. SAAs470]WOE38686.1 DsbA family protein [Acinetobacter sp. SAAs474]